MADLFKRVSSDKYNKFNTESKGSDDYKEIVSFVNNPNGTNEVVTNGQTYARTYKSGNNNQVYIAGTYYTLNVNNNDGEISLDPYTKAEFTNVTQNINASSGSGTATIYLGTTYNLSTEIVPSNNINYSLIKHSNLAGLISIKYGSTYINGGSVTIKNINGTYIAYYDDDNIEFSNYNINDDISSYQIGTTSAGKLETTTNSKTGTISTWSEVTCISSVTSRSWVIYGHEKNKTTDTCIQYTATIAQTSISQKATPKAPWYSYNSEIIPGITGTNVTGTDVIYGNAFPSSVTISPGTPYFAFPSVWSKTPSFKQMGTIDDDWNETTSINVKLSADGSNVVYKVYKHSNIQSEGSWNIEWK